MKNKFVRRILAELYFADPIIVILVIILIIIAVLFIARKAHKKRIERVQIAAIERQTREVGRNVSLNREPGKEQLCNALGEGLEEFSVLHFYRLDRKNRLLKRKLPTSYVKELCEGDIGVLTYKGKDVLAFEKTGTLSDEDKKRVRFRL